MRRLAFLGLLLAQPLAAQQLFTVTPARPAPGAIVRLSLTPEKESDVSSVRGTLAGEPLHFQLESNGSWHAIGGIPVDATGTLNARAFIRRKSGKTDTVKVSMSLPAIPKPKAEPLAVDSSFSKPMDEATADRINAENARARALGVQSHDEPPLWTESFMKPRMSVVTSPFGSGRVFNGAVTSRHLGIDFRGGVGDTIRAANRGVVVLVDEFFLAGNVVYIDHGGGVVSGYFHMSRPLVAKGDTVERGQVIGLVGKTGRVTGPHLHWTVRYGTTTVNPEDLLSLDPAWYSAKRGQ
jgi:murein DD-endopeptidase MepM/ murein hydrolase activator NlpD